MNPQDETDKTLKEALAKLPKTTTPPAHLEHRVVARLRERGWIRKQAPTPWLRAAMAVAAALLLGLFLGRQLATPKAVPSTPEPQYLLVIHESKQFRQQTAGMSQELVQEYSHWARSLSTNGQLLMGRKLQDQGSWLFLNEGTPASRPMDLEASQTYVGGFFILNAPNYEAALTIAQSCPHLRYGGTIEVRPVDPT